MTETRMVGIAKVNFVSLLLSGLLGIFSPAPLAAQIDEQQKKIDAKKTTPATTTQPAKPTGFIGKVIGSFNAFRPSSAYQPPPPDPVLSVATRTPVVTVNQSIVVDAAWSRQGTRASYFFSWGDDKQSPSSPSSQEAHVYQTPGVFTVEVSAFEIIGDHVFRDQRPLKVTVNPAPTQGPTTGGGASPAQITLHTDVKAALVGSTVDFTVGMERPVSGSQFHYFFGDGKDATGGNNITYRYSSPGTFKAHAESIVLEGPIAISRPVTLDISAATRPTLTITPTSTSGGRVTVTTTQYPPDSGTTFTNDFGDKTPPALSDHNGSVDHQYPAPGTYPITVTTHHHRLGDTTQPRDESGVSRTVLYSVPPPDPLPPPPDPEPTLPHIVLIAALLAITVSGSALIVRASIHAVFSPGTTVSTGIAIDGHAPHASVKFKPGAKPSTTSFRLL